jgi:hypothetical protein
MLLFQIETIAQVKEGKIEESNYISSSSFSSILTKNSTDEELNKLQKIFSIKKYKLKISKVKRNKKGEIIGIKLDFDSGKTYNRILERKSTEPINNIKIFINSDKNDDTTCGFEEINNDVANISLNKKDDNNQPKDYYWSLDNMKKNGKEVVLIINGKIKGATEKVKISWDEELGEMVEITPEKFEKKYNQKADKNQNYYEVETVKSKEKSTIVFDEITKKKESEKPNSEAAYAVLVEAEFSEDGNLSYMDKIKLDKLVDAKKALILFNGKEINYEDLDKIDAKTISSFGNTIASHAMKKYGEKGKNGVIFINTKAYDLENNPFMKEYENKKQIELKAQENFSNSKEVIEERKKKLEERKIKLEQIKEERKNKIEQKKE